MKRALSSAASLLGGCAAIALCAALGGSAYAQQADPDAIAHLRATLKTQAEQLDAQRLLLERQMADIAAQRAQLERLADGRTDAGSRVASAQDQPLPPLSTIVQGQLRAGGYASIEDQSPQQAIPVADQIPPPQPAVPARPVGEAPPETGPQPELAALPEGVGVLTSPGRIVIDPSFDFSNSSSNRLVFRGVEIVTGVQVGVIEASDVDRNTFTGSIAARYGVTNRLEIEARLPYVYRNDQVTTLVQRDSTVTSTMDLEGDNIGDVEVTARYQLNSGRGGGPVYVGNFRVKTDTGRGPFDVDRDEFGVATELPTGSGFWGLEPSLTILIPSDPAVIFASVGYLYHAPKDIDQTVNGVLVGRVDPGDSINASLGFGFAVNPRFSFSLGYRHSYIFPTKTDLNNARFTSEDLQAGSLQFGWSWRLTESATFNNNFEFGVTEDAPDVRIVFRVPFIL